MYQNVKTTKDPINYKQLEKISVLNGMGLDYRTEISNNLRNNKRTISIFLSIPIFSFLISVICRLTRYLEFISPYSIPKIVFFIFLFIFSGFLLYFFAAGSNTTYEERRFEFRMKKYHLVSKNIDDYAAIFVILFVAFIWSLFMFSGIWTSTFLTYAALLPIMVFSYTVLQRMLNHYISWIIASPRFNTQTRDIWREKWSMKAKVWDICIDMFRNLYKRNPSKYVTPDESSEETIKNKQEADGRAISACTKTFIQVIGIYLMGFFILLITQFVDKGKSQPYVGMMIILFLLICVFVLALRHTLSFGLVKKDSLIRFWGMFVNWCNYNLQNTRAPGVFQSPAGSRKRRVWLLTCLLFLYTSFIAPMAYYFPVVMYHVGPKPWIYVDSRSFLSQNNPYFKDHRISNASNMTVSKRLKSRPETWFFISLIGLRHGYYLFIYSLVLSFVLSIIIPVFFFLLIAYACGGPVIDLYYRLESSKTPGNNHAETTSWETYIERLRASEKLSDYLWLGTSIINDYPILLHKEILHDHSWILGDSGSGKTARGLAPLVSQLIRLNIPDNTKKNIQGHSIVIIDLKGDRSLFRGAQIEANKAGIPFKWFTNVPGFSTYVFNPFHQSFLEHLTINQQTDVILQSLGLEHGEGYGLLHFSLAHRKVLFEALRINPGVKSFRELQNTLRKKDLLANLTKKDCEEAADLFILIDSLVHFEALNITPEDENGDQICKNGIDMSEIIAKPNVLYFFLPASIEVSSVRRLGKLALYSLLASAFLKQQHTGKPCRVYLFIDEFQQIVSENFELFLRQARSMGIALILANQTVSDLKTHEKDLIPIIQGNTRFKHIFASTDNNQIEALMKASGERFYYSGVWNDPDVEILGTEKRYSRMIDGDPAVFYDGQIGIVRSSLLRNDIIEASDDKDQSIVHISRSSGYTQFSGFPFRIFTNFHISEKEYGERMRHPWPQKNQYTIESRVVRSKSENLTEEDPIVSALASDRTNQNKEENSDTSSKMRDYVKNRLRGNKEKQRE